MIKRFSIMDMQTKIMKINSLVRIMETMLSFYVLDLSACERMSNIIWSGVW